MATIRYRWSHRGYIAIGVAAVAIAAAIGFRGESFDGVVVRVIDGDTIAFKGDPREVIVRLWGIDAPEMDQVWGMESKIACGRLCMGETVHVEVKDVDRYKRRVCRVTLPDGRDLGDELVRSGAAWWSAKYAPRDLEKRRLQGEARGAKKGLWGHPPCIDPAVWRRRR